MGLISRIIERVKGARQVDLTFVKSISAQDAGIEGIGQAIDRDSCYVELYLESLRLARARKFTTKFNAVVYSFVTLSRLGKEPAQLAAVSRPMNLTELDPNSLDRIITVSKRMMGATPFRGSPMSIELGLFSVKSGSLLTPVLDYVTRVSSTAGISFVGAIKPFLPLITEGMDLIAGQAQNTELEVGVETDLSVTEGCVMAIIACPKGSIDASKLSLDKDHKLLLDGKALEKYGYAVFSLRPAPNKIDFGVIPELKERFDTFLSAISAGKQKDAKDAREAFRLATIASPDLIPTDVKELKALTKQMYTEAFPPGGKADFGPTELRIKSLSEIGLYD